MDFGQAVDAHVDWKWKLSAYLRKPDKSLDPATLEVDDQCALGKWIHDEGRAYSGLTEFAELQTTHAEFHRAAADIVRRADKGESVSDEVAMGAKTNYGVTSSRVIRLIQSVQRKVQQ
jgi:hypothetical protein